MEIYCTACKGIPFKLRYSGEMMSKPVYLVTVIGESFVVRTAPCRNKKCKKVNVLIKNVDLEYEPQEDEHVRYLS